jgi:hypothetical protein
LTIIPIGGRRFQMLRTVMIATAVATGLLCLAPSAQAEEDPQPERARGVELAERADTAYRDGRYEEAVRLLREARNLLLGEEEEMVIFNLATALSGMGDCSSLREAQELYSDLSAGEGAILVDARARLERVTALLTERCQEEPPRDEPPPPEASPEEELPPGEEPSGDEVGEGGGDTDGDGGEPLLPPVPEEETPPSRRSGGEVVGYTLLGAGMALAATGSGFWMGASSATNDRDGACGRQCASQGALNSWIFFDDRREMFALLGDIFFFGGVAIAAGGLVWALVARYQRLRLQQDEPAAMATVSLRPVLNPRGGGFVIEF